MNHYQDLHAVSVYLSFEYPDKFTIYKAKIYDGFKNLVSFAENRGKVKSEVWKLENCNRLCEQIMAAIDADPDIATMSHARLNDNCYGDPNNRLLAMDIMLFGSRLTALPEPANEGVS